jgi:1-aminocyclopropane-1-carboxylate deaminase
VNDLKPDLNNVSLDTWDHSIFRQNELEATVLRLDNIHPDISGNKWFKLKYYLENARLTDKNRLISFGGAYSNHLLALAAAAGLYGFSSIGYIRGEKPGRLSQTLLAAKEYGMELRFLTRHEYDQKKKIAGLDYQTEYPPDVFDKNDPDYLLIPEGGAGIDGIRGAGEILSLVQISRYSHICTAAGTGTTLAGLINSARTDQQIIGVSVLKGTRDLEPMDTSWIKNETSLNNVRMIHEDHFGGYAKYTETLIDFMNQIYKNSGIPTDFVYTGKLFFSVIRMAEMKLFPPGSRILVLHTGGLQGNRSLAPGLLQF